MKKILSALFILAAVTVTAQEKIYAPTLTAPANAATNQAVNVLLDWNPVSGGMSYQINLDTSASFTNPQVVNVQYSAWQTANLLFSATYYWRVRAIDAADDTSNWSTVRNFNTAICPTTKWPSEGSNSACIAPILTWNALAGVSKYECQFDSAATFDSPYLKSGIITTGVSYQVYNNYYGAPYHWRVRGIHVNDTSDWSIPVTFTTRDSVAFAPSSIANAATGIHPSDSLKIKGIYGTNRYEINFDDDAAFTTPVVFYWDSSAINLRLVSGVLYDTTARGAMDTIPFGTFYYRIRLLSDVDSSKWTEVRTLSTVQKVTMLTPLDEDTIVDVTSSFTWDAIRGAKYYILEYGTDPTFAVTTKENVTATSFTPATDLLSKTNYYWRVRCVTSSDTTSVYDEFHFKTYYGVGVEENMVGSWSVYPNPTTGSFNLNIEANSSARMEILNLLGDVVYSQGSLTNGSNAISIDNLNDGIYMMRLFLDEKVYTSRIVKK